MSKPLRARPTVQLWWCNLIHVVNDGYIAGLALLLPYIAVDLGLSYTEAGLLKTAIQGAISASQIPAGLLSERVGEMLTLGLGTAWFSLSYAALILAGSYSVLLLLVILSGVGGGVYHPVGTGLIASVFPADKSGPAIGTLNFFGDVGKVVFPALAGVLVVYIGWRGSAAVLGGIGAAISLLYLVYFRREIGRRWRQLAAARTSALDLDGKRDNGEARPRGWGIRQPGQFALYSVVGFIDTGIRSGVVTFLGFALVDAGVEKAQIGWLVSLTFVGGAFGKLLCGVPMRRWGTVKTILLTELLMIAGCWALPSIPAGWSMLVFLPLFGFMLNGTSSVLYIGLVPTLDPDRHSRGYALYYTLNFFAGAAAPYLFGLVGDAHGLAAGYYAAGAFMLVGLPLVFFLRETKPIRAPA